MTVTTGGVEHAARSAADIARRGFRVIKLKVGGPGRAEDVERLAAVARAAPGCQLILDANGGYEEAEDVLRLLKHAAARGVDILLLEQPLPPAHAAGLRDLCLRSPVPVAADEGATCVDDVIRLARERLAHVVNVKLTKSGLLQAWEMIRVAQALGLGLMVGAMVETVVTTSVSACLAAGMGGVTYVDLDTPLWLVDAPVDGGYAQDGPRLDLSVIRRGHGVVRRS